MAAPKAQAAGFLDVAREDVRRAVSVVRGIVDQLRSPPRTLYQRVLFWTFPRNQAEELASSGRANVEAVAPKPFAEVFGDGPAKGAPAHFALALLGPAGIASLVAAVIAAAVLIDFALLSQPALSQPPVSQPNEVSKSGLQQRAPVQRKQSPGKSAR